MKFPQNFLAGAGVLTAGAGVLTVGAGVLTVGAGAGGEITGVCTALDLSEKRALNNFACTNT